MNLRSIIKSSRTTHSVKLTVSNRALTQKPAQPTRRTHFTSSPRMESQREIVKFQEFLRIRSISAEGPKGAYQQAVDFLREYAASLGMTQSKVFSIVAGKPILIITVPGTRPELSAILLNSHYDVVPANLELWTVDPFGDGKIYARGTQDMKCVCTQYLEAMHNLLQKGPLQRTIHLSYLPDEEIGGLEGAKLFLASPEFSALNVGVALDEGLANPSEAYTVFYGERAPWWVKFTASGPTGHGSRFIPRTAIEKLTELLNKAYTYRREQQALLHPGVECEGGCAHSMAKKLGDVVTLNITAVKAYTPGPEFSDGFAVNVIPTEAVAAMDMRIPPSIPLDDIEKMLQQWTAEEGLNYSFYTKMPEHHVTDISESNPWWVALKNGLDAAGKAYEPEIFPAATDSRYFRAAKLPCFGFSPIRRTPILLHDNDEFLPMDVYLEGISTFEHVIASLANVSE